MLRSKLGKGLLVMILIFTLTACGKSPSVKSLEQDISQTITKKQVSQAELESLEQRYQKLTDSEKRQVANYQELQELQRKMDQLAIDHVESLIKSINPSVLDGQDSIQKARRAYDDLTDDQQAYVVNFSDLLQAEKQFKETVFAQTFQLMDKMSDLEVQDLAAVDTLKTLYSKLTASQIQRLPQTYQGIDSFIKDYKINLFDYLVDNSSYQSGLTNGQQTQELLNLIQIYQLLSAEDQTQAQKIETFKKMIQNYLFYYNNRQWDDPVFQRYRYLQECQKIPFEKLTKYPASLKNRKIKITGQIIKSNHGSLIQPARLWIQEDNKPDQIYRLTDLRIAKEPKLKVGDSLSFYGSYMGLEEGEPQIDLRYTDLDNLGVITNNDPLMKINFDEALEDKRLELYKAAKTIK